MSSHYPVNTDMHVVSDQLGSHKGKSWSSAGGSDTVSVAAFLSYFIGSVRGRKKRWGQLHCAPSEGCQAGPAAYIARPSLDF